MSDSVMPAEWAPARPGGSDPIRFRLFDLTCAVVGLLLALPILLLAALAIRLTSPGPVLYRARRVGQGGRPFTMYKLRTMRVAPTGLAPSQITAPDDERVFPVGRVLRRSKIDELPQLVNVLLGHMAIVGPRPEVPDFVERHYAPEHWDTLNVRPGLTSPGTLYQTVAGDEVLAGGNTEVRYLERLLPTKLALDLVYVRHRSLTYDVSLVLRTIRTLIGILAGRRQFGELPELAPARRLTVPAIDALTRMPISSHLILLAIGIGTAGCNGYWSERRLDRLIADWAAQPGAAILVGAGDVATCSSDYDERTAMLLDRIPGTIFTTGDNVYPDGTEADFVRCYEPSWGRHRQRTRPVPGNHEYHTPDAAGYFAYFGSNAGEPAKGYYSYRLGGWHIVALNSEIDMTYGSAQFEWFRADLAASKSPCVAAYWHRPFFTSGGPHDPWAPSRAVWEELYRAGADLVIVGHAHNYERFAPQIPDGSVDWRYGIRQFVVGTGGAGAHGFAAARRNSEVRSRSKGVLVFLLEPTGYRWRFISVPGWRFSDEGRTACHEPPGDSARPAREETTAATRPVTARVHAEGSP